MQVAIISIIEDARVELLSIKEFPGLKELWIPYHMATGESKNLNKAYGPLTSRTLFSRLSRALVDENYIDNNGWITRARDMFFKNKEKEEDTVNNDKSYSNIAALLIHVAKIDENYEDKEKEIIKKTLIGLGATISNIDKLIADASVIEENSNQILSFTREVKNAPESDKIRIVESLWKIIYSDDNADMYETNLMRRLAGLLYIDAKTMGDLKEKVKKELSK